MVNKVPRNTPSNISTLLPDPNSLATRLCFQYLTRTLQIIGKVEKLFLIFVYHHIFSLFFVTPSLVFFLPTEHSKMFCYLVVPVGDGSFPVSWRKTEALM